MVVIWCAVASVTMVLLGASVPPADPLDDMASAEFSAQTPQPFSLRAGTGRRMDMTDQVVSPTVAPQHSSIALTITPDDDQDTFTAMLQRAGVGAFDAARVEQMVRQSAGEIAPGTPVRIVLGQRTAPDLPRQFESLSIRARFDLELTITRQGDKLAVTRNALEVDETPLRIRGVVGQSLYRSARAAGAPFSAVQEYLRALDQHISLGEDVHPDDEFDMVLSHKRASNGDSAIGGLLYASLIRNGKPFKELLRWGGDGQFQAADGMSRVQQASVLMAPVAGQITSGFGIRRHPILGFARFHAGVDFGAPWGAPIYAANDGAVSFAGYNGGYGNFVKLDHGGGIGTGYAHMSRIAVSPGQRVRRGQIIGFVGSTGLSTGSHLHYELYQNGRPVNPAGVGLAMRAVADPVQTAAFKARLAQLQAVRPGAALPQPQGQVLRR